MKKWTSERYEVAVEKVRFQSVQKNILNEGILIGEKVKKRKITEVELSAKKKKRKRKIFEVTEVKSFLTDASIKK